MPAFDVVPAVSTFHTIHETDGGRITVVLDDGAFDYHIDASSGYNPWLMESMLRHLNAMGYEPMPEEECAAILGYDGSVRVYLVPVEPVDDTGMGA